MELVAEHHISSENELHQFRQQELIQRKQHLEKANNAFRTTTKAKNLKSSKRKKLPQTNN